MVSVGTSLMNTMVFKKWFLNTKYQASSTYPTLLCDFINNKYAVNSVNTTFDNIFTFSRTTTGTFVGADGYIQSSAINTPRFTYNPATLLPEGLLIEDQRTNLAINSEAFNSWTLSNSTITTTNTTETIDPSGNNNAELWTRSSTANAFVGQTISKAASALTYTMSVYAKKKVGNYLAIRMQGTYPARCDMVVNLSTGTISTAATATTFTNPAGKIQDAGNGWYRISITGTTDTTASVTMYLSFNSGGGTLDTVDTASNSAGYLWGAQIEESPFATSYIPTTTASVTRGRDAITNLSSNTYPYSSFSSATNFSTYVDYKSAAESSASLGRFIKIATPSAEAISLVHNLKTVQFFTTTSSTTTYSPTKNRSSDYVAYTRTKYAMSIRNGDAAITVDGLTAATGTNTMPNSLDAFYLGFNTSFSLNGTMREFRYYNIDVSDSELQRITT